MKYVAFLRAINVGGHAIVSMSDLKDAFVAAGCQGVKTFIQSGNVLFESPEKNPTPLFQKVRAKVRLLLGHEPGICFRTVGELEGIVRSAPFQSLAAEPDIKVSVVFLSESPRSRPQFPLISTAEALEALGMKNLAVFVVSRRKKNGLYGFPNNFIEKQLGVPATTRNWSTLLKIVGLTTVPLTHRSIIGRRASAIGRELPERQALRSAGEPRPRR